MIDIFTGIIEELGKVRSVRASAGQYVLAIACHRVLEGTKTGDSIAVSGTCLTVTRLVDGGFEADVMPETLRMTVLADLGPGSAVNLERALRLGDRLGGHLISGHVDGVGRILSVTREDNALVYRIEAPEAITGGLVRKGSVAVDGISLTVSGITPEGFEVSLIPHTLKMTTLGQKGPGDRVNLESDLIGKYVAKYLQGLDLNKRDGITMDYLSRHGFV